MSLEQTRLEKDFQKFHKKNPHVWEMFKHFTMIAVRSGRDNYSARAIIEQIRWYSDMSTDSPTIFKIPNNTIPYYARLFHAAHPKHQGFFKTMPVTAAKNKGQVEMSL